MKMNRKKIAIILVAFGILLIAFTSVMLGFCTAKVKNSETVKLYVQPNTSVESITKELQAKGVLESGLPYKVFMSLLGDNGKVRSGFYELESGLTQLDLVKKLVRGLQTPVNLVIGKVRTKEDFAKKLSSQLMISDRDLLAAIENRTDASDLFENVLTDTYQVYWNIGAEKLLERLKSEADKWWNAQSEGLNRTGLSRHEIIVLASIVEEETNKNDEKPIIAGVYLNRLRKDMLLQADPTVKFAVGDFTIRRVMYKHLQTDSPYNTYMYKGLPPSPICLPEQSSIRAVLNYQKHDFIFFCAKEDFSGYHNFARTPDEHYANANRYQAALNKAGIR